MPADKIIGTSLQLFFARKYWLSEALFTLRGNLLLLLLLPGNVQCLVFV